MESKYIVVEGIIGAGKSTLVRSLATLAGVEPVLEEFEENPYLSKFYEDPDAFALQTELFFLERRKKQMLQQLLSSPGLLLADYHISKSPIFAAITLKNTDYQIFSSKFETVEMNLIKPDLYVFLNVPPAVALQNIASRGRSYETAISEDYLQQLYSGYMDHFKGLNDDKRLLLQPEEIYQQQPDLIMANISRKLSLNDFNNSL